MTHVANPYPLVRSPWARSDMNPPPLRDESARAQWVRFRTVAARLGVDVDEAVAQANAVAQVRYDLDDAEVLLMVLARIAGDR